MTEGYSQHQLRQQPCACTRVEGMLLKQLLLLLFVLLVSIIT